MWRAARPAAGRRLRGTPQVFYSRAMSAPRLALLAAAAIAALFGAALLAVDRLFAEPADPRAPPPAQATPTEARPTTPPAEPPPPPPLPPPPGPAPLEAAAAAPAPEAIADPAAAPAGRRDLLSSLAAARSRILECGGVTVEESELGARARRAAARREAGRPRTVLRLDLEPLEGQVVVRGIEVVSQGGPDGEDLVRCAREVLEGQTLEASSAHPGQRLWMRYVVDDPRR